MSLLTKGQINAKRGRRYETLHVEEWGGDVRIQSLTVGERGQLEAYVGDDKEPRNNGHLRAMLCALAIVDENGVRVYEDLDADDFLEMDNAPVTLVADAAWNLSGMGRKAQEAIEKKSEPAPATVSS